MNDPRRPSLGRFYILMMIGSSLILIGFISYIILQKPSVPARDFSAIPAAVNYPAPELTLVDLEGNTVSLNDHLGSVVLVNLWATWCPPCKEEMPILQIFYEKYKKEGFELLAVDQEETFEVVKPFVQQFGLTFPVWLDENYQAQHMFHTINLPSSYVIDRFGRVRLMWIGGISKRNLEKYVPDLINE